MNNAILIAFALMCVVTILIILYLSRPREFGEVQNALARLEQIVQTIHGVDPQAMAAANHSLEMLLQQQRQLPNQMLRCIQGNVNTLKGQAAELIAYLQLNASYDRLLPFNSITDFIGIKFPKGDDPGHLDFIDIKTGSARLSREQSSLKRIIEDKQINFVKVTVKTDQPSLQCEERECEPT